MARKKDKEKAIILRKRGLSYSDIKREMGINKSTLSGWLRDMPLSEERIKELRANNPVRIERYRNTMKNKRDFRLNNVFKKVSLDIGKLTEREVFIAGLFLYWAEGGKTKSYTTVLTNTNPNMLVFFIKWLKMLGVEKSSLKVSLHLYTDMNIQKQINYWSKKLGIDKKQFRKPHIKKSKLSDITYHNGFGQGTCSVLYDNRDISEYVLQSIRYLEGL